MKFRSKKEDKLKYSSYFEEYDKFVDSKEFMHLCFEEAGYCESLTNLYEYIDREKYYTPFELEVKKKVYGS